MSTPRHVTTIYRALLRELGAIPDVEIKHYYRGRYRGMAATLIQGCRALPTEGEAGPGPQTELHRSRYAKFRKELRQIVNTNDGSHDGYIRMMDLTYARRGARRWELLDALYPISLSRPSSETLSSSRLPRRLHPPPPLVPPLTQLIQPYKEQKFAEREKLKPPSIRLTNNRMWRHRTEVLERVSLPLRFALPEDKEVVERMAKGELRRLAEWQVLGQRLWENALLLAQVDPENRTGPPRRLGGGLKGGREGAESVESEIQESQDTQQRKQVGVVQHRIPVRARRRMYRSLLDRIPLDRRLKTREPRMDTTMT